MTPGEFSAWLDGFSSAIEGRPTKAQWDLIKRKAAEIESQPLVVYPPVYPPPVIQPWYPTPTWPSYPTTSIGSEGTCLTSQELQVTN